MKWLKRILAVLSILILGAIVYIGMFVYRAKVGYKLFETKAHDIDIPNDRPAVLVISKTNGYRHSEAIDAAQPMFEAIGKAHNWFIYSTEDAGIFNRDQLNQFEVVVYNNASGTILNEQQQNLLKTFIEKGGGFIGIHAAGDGSHKWSWYRENIICTDFSHHPIKNQFQTTQVNLVNAPDSTWATSQQWDQNDEWYIFLNQPSEKGANYLYTINGDSIDPNGNILWLKNYDFGMGIVHPVAWYKDVAAGRSFYTSMGHTASTFTNSPFVQMIIDAIKWTGKIEY